MAVGSSVAGDADQLRFGLKTLIADMTRGPLHGGLRRPPREQGNTASRYMYDDRSRMPHLRQRSTCRLAYECKVNLAPPERPTISGPALMGAGAPGLPGRLARVRAIVGADVSVMAIAFTGFR